MRKLTRKIKILLVVLAVLVLAVVFFVIQWWPTGPKPGSVLDEAKLANRAPESFPAAAEDYFQKMDQNKDGVIALTPAEVKGRNTWLVWTGGDDRLWNKLTVASFGALDLLKTISSRDDKESLLWARRDNRWHYLGLVNEPCFEKAKGPDPERFGLWLDKRTVSPDCPPDPFENETKYPGVQIGARGKPLPSGTQYMPKDGKMPVGSYYGYATGVVGLRLFPNPDFDEAAARYWDPEKFYTDPKYYFSKDLIRPYRVGMSCAFCHVGPNPIKPPADPEHPQWENLSSNVGAQYFWIDRIFDWDGDQSSYIFQMFHTSRPGSLDTSLVSTDNINNPRTTNAIYNLGPRLEQGGRYGKETLGETGSILNKQFNDHVPAGHPLAKLFVPPSTVYSPRVLKDGSDSVGALGALNRVYLNIGLFSEEWTLHFNPLVGGKKTTPILISDARRNSSYWVATEAQTFDMAQFFLRTTEPHKLRDAPHTPKDMGDPAKDKDYAQTLDRGKVVFAENCARCHSSKLPEKTKTAMDEGCSGPNYLKCWNDYWAWTKTGEFKSQMTDIVNAPDFLDGNYLSSEFRVPVTLLQTNACSPLATNAIRGNIWDNFSSDTYKDLPPVGTITVYDPITGQSMPHQMPGGGRGFTRPASLISLWSTAPFLLNNSVGKFNPEVSVAARLESFNDSIEQMLLIKPRDKDAVLGDKVPGKIDRTTEISWIRIKPGYVPEVLQGWGQWFFPRIVGDDGLLIGPIPKDTPVNLIASLLIRPEELGWWDRAKRDRELIDLIFGRDGINRSLAEIGQMPGDPAAIEAYNKRAQEIFTRKNAEGNSIASRLMALSKCPDYVVNRGHYFGTGYDNEPALTPEQKKDLIEFLKTF
jgi:hypothetical protein